MLPGGWHDRSSTSTSVAEARRMVSKVETKEHRHHRHREEAPSQRWGGGWDAGQRPQGRSITLVRRHLGRR